MTPRHLSDLSADANFKFKSKASVQSGYVIYIVSIATVLSTIAILPLISVDIGINASGQITSISERAVVKSARAGIVAKTFLLENRSVKKGDTLLLLQSTALNDHAAFITHRCAEASQKISDIRKLLVCSGDTKYILPELTTQFYSQSLSDFKQRLAGLEKKTMKALGDYKRNNALYRGEVIAQSEHEN